MSLKLTIKKTPHEREWVARVTEDGKLVDGPYFANDKRDAEDTGAITLTRARNKVEARKLPKCELIKFARISLRNGCDCFSCFTCAALAVAREDGLTDAQIDPERAELAAKFT